MKAFVHRWHLLRRLLPLLGLAPMVAACQPDTVKLSGPTMGSSYHISYVRDEGTPSPEAVQASIRQLLDELDRSVSTYRDDSSLASFNAAPAGTCQTMPPMAIDLARAARKLATDSDGAYDVTLLPVLDYWKFGPKAARERAAAARSGNGDGLTVAQLVDAGSKPASATAAGAAPGKEGRVTKAAPSASSPTAPPPETAPPGNGAATSGTDTNPATTGDDALQALRTRTGMQHLRIDGDRLCKDAPITVEFNSIAAGYIIDRMAARFAAQGIRNYLIEVTGEMRAGGQKPDGQPWRIGVEAPLDDARVAQRIVNLRDMAISTSGDYRIYREENGRRLSHLIDPRTLSPITHKLAAATVVTDSAMQADGLSTLLMVLGPEQGYNYAVQHQLAALLVSRTPSGFATRTTPAFEQRFPVSSNQRLDGE